MPRSLPRISSATILRIASASSPALSVLAAAELRALGLVEESFGHVIANPPFHDSRRPVRLPPDALKAGAHAMPDAELDDWARFMARMTAPGGEATIIHKADALARLLAVLDAAFRRAESAAAASARRRRRRIGCWCKASRVAAVRCRSCRASCCTQDGNAFTPAAQDILRGGAALLMSASV